MVAPAEPRTYSVDLDFLEAWEVLNSLMERRARLDPHGEATLTTVNVRAEEKLRAVTGIPKPIEAPWGGIEQFQAEDR